MDLNSLNKRASRVRKFVREAASLSAIPGLVVAAVARDNPVGQRRLRDLLIGNSRGVVEVRTRATGGEPAFIDTYDLGQLISFEEVLIDRIYDLSLVPFAPELIVDCGTHNGLFSLLAGLRYSRAELIAYEPERRNFRAAQAQLSRFKERVRLVEAAVYTRTGDASFCRGESNSGHLTTQSHESTQCVRVIDPLQEAHHWKGKRLLLKMDIEGAETEVLPHVIDFLPMRCACFVEVHAGQQVLENLLRRASGLGFDALTTRTRGTFIDAFLVRDRTGVK